MWFKFQPNFKSYLGFCGLGCDLDFRSGAFWDLGLTIIFSEAQFVSIRHQWIMAKCCGGAMAITVLFRTTISDLLCSDSPHIVLVTVIATAQYWDLRYRDKTAARHISTICRLANMHTAQPLQKSDIELFAPKRINIIVKCDCWRVYLKWRHDGPGWRQEDHFTRDAGCNSRQLPAVARGDSTQRELVQKQS